MRQGHSVLTQEAAASRLSESKVLYVMFSRHELGLNKVHVL